jgi:copper chaperone NosL
MDESNSSTADRKGLTEFFQGEISKVTRIALILVALALVPSLFLPVWKITLNAPQYPGGLDLMIYAQELRGDLDEINILNHYIGMAEIRPDEFREFVFIPFFILRFVAFAVLATLVARMAIAAIGYIDFALFGAVMMFDFQTWLTRFGQGLAQGAPLEIDPFTPKFFGRTEIGQFTVDSYPALGGVLMIAAGMLGPVLLVYELWRRRRLAAA